MLCDELMGSIETHRQQMVEDQEYREAQAQLEKAMAFEIRRTVESTKSVKTSDDDYWDEDWDD